jgi:hypothetical protein
MLEILSGLIIILSFITEIEIGDAIYVPEYYPWWIFSVGIILGSFVFYRRVIQVIKSKGEHKAI